MAAQEPTVHEQLLLELVNRARLDPSGEASRFGIGLNEGLTAGTISSAPKQPLAVNPFLVDAARQHSVWIIANDDFSHTGAGGSTPTQRMAAAGYAAFGSFSSGENIAIRGSSGGVAFTSFTNQLHEDLFRSPGHRTNILNGNFRELGTGLADGLFEFDNGTFESLNATENFARLGDTTFITGVVIADADGDNFFDIDEARAGIDIEALLGGLAQGSDTSMSAGGYAIGVAAGTYDIEFSGGDLLQTVECTVSTSGGNVKLDLAGQGELLCSASITLGDGAVDAVLLGIAGTNATGNAVANTLLGNGGSNRLMGAGGNDFLNGGLGNDDLRGGADNDRLLGGKGRDMLRGEDGRDLFDFNSVKETGKTASSRDRILDFKRGTDDVDLAGIDARSGGTDNAFRFIGTKSFSGTSGQLRYFKENLSGTANDRTIVEGDIDGNRVADFQIELKGLFSLTSSDFVL